MQSIYFLIPLSLVLLAFAVWAIRFAVRSGQFDDLDNAAEQIILEDKQMRREQLQGSVAPSAQSTSSQSKLD